LKRKLRTQLALRLVGICFFGCLSGYLFFDSPFWLAGLWTALITAALFYFTLQYVTQSERKLTAFLQTLGQNDFTVTFPESKQSEEYDLHHAFNKLTQMFTRLRSEKEAQHQLLQVLVEHVAVPILCFDERTRDVFQMNEAAKTLLQSPYLQKIDSLKRVDPGLPAFLSELSDNVRTQLKLTVDSRVMYLSVSSRHILFDNRMIKLVVFIDVSSELATKEADTWRKLLRVLTHEISNSAIPLSTLSSYINQLVAEAQASGRELTVEERQDVRESLRTIDERSKSLKDFVQNFRSVNQIPEPSIERIDLAGLLHDAAQLYTRELEKENILLITHSYPETYAFADRNLTQQIVINLMKNAMEAMSNMKQDKEIELSLTQSGKRYLQLHVRDSGTGIDPEDLEQIFIPFYSTKKGGSGIGLSISQQIMQKQKGDIAVSSMPGKGSVFTLTFIT